MKGDTNAIKPAELIHPHAEILKEALIFDAMYLQKCIEYAGGDYMVVTKTINWTSSSLVL